MPASSGQYIGKGTYSIADAARIVRAPYTTVRGWLNPKKGVIRRKFDPENQLISFIELMELHFIKMFMDEGVSPKVIHAAVGSRARNARR